MMNELEKSVMPLSLSEAKSFLTKSDLQKLEKQIEAGTLQASVVGTEVPHIVVRKQQIPLFVLLELIGTL